MATTPSAIDTKLDEYRHSFEEAMISFFWNQPEKNREILGKASKRALVDGLLGYHEFFQAELSFAGNDLQAALRHYETAVKEEPTNSLFAANLGITQLALGNTHEALLVLRHALALNPNETHAEIGVICALVETEQFKPARDLARRLFGKRDLADVYKFELLQVLADLDDDDGALSIAKQLLRKFPENLYCKTIRTRIRTKKTASLSNEYKQRPYLRALLLCDSINVVDGKAQCTGVFDRINTFAAPTITASFVIFISFLARRLKSKVDLSITDRTGRTVLRHSAKAFNEDLTGATGVVVNIPGLALPLTGPYLIQLKVDGKKIGKAPFRVIKVEPRPDYSAEETKRLLNDPNVIKSVRIRFQCGRCQRNYEFQMNLDLEAPLGASATPFPDDDQLQCSTCDSVHHIKAIRLQAREILGRPVNAGHQLPSSVSVDPQSK